MRIFIISDTHFNHNKIVQYTSRKNYLEVDNVEAMNEFMIKQWNSVVKKEDIVYHLGDFAFGGADVFKEIVKRLNGRIRIIIGNHDPHKNQQWYLNAGFDAVYDHPIIIEKWYILSHEPISYLSESMPYVNIHGHMHDESYSSSQRYNVSWEITKGVPTLFSDIKAHYIELNEIDAKTKSVYPLLRKSEIAYKEGYMNGVVDGRKNHKI